MAEEKKDSAVASAVDLESGQGPRSIPHWKLVADQALVTPEVLDWKYDGSGTAEDPYVVKWIENDPRNPMTWSKTYKYSISVTMALATLAVAFCSSAYSGGKLCNGRLAGWPQAWQAFPLRLS